MSPFFLPLFPRKANIEKGPFSAALKERWLKQIEADQIRLRALVIPAK